MFGKTAILAKQTVAMFGVPTLFVANKKSLLDDAAEEFVSGIKGVKKKDVVQIKDGWFGTTKITPSMKKEDIKPITAPIVVATIQSLDARLKDPRTKDYLLEWLWKICKFVVCDESQSSGTKIWDEVLTECKAPYRMFLSATPRRTDGATIKIHAYSGDNLYFTTAEEQIKKGRLCELDIAYHVYDHNLYNEADGDINYQEMYSSCIVNNESRNRFIVSKAKEMTDEERQILVLVQFIEHGHILREMLLEAGYDAEDVKFVWGDTPDKMRQAAIAEFKKGNFKIMIGSTIFDAGVNMPTIAGVILGGAGNSDITLIQRIGRGARTVDYEKVLGYTPKFMIGKNGEKVTKVIDFMDINAKFFHRQSINRYKNASDEFGKSRVHIVGGDTSTLKITKKKKVENKQNIDQFAAQFEMLAEFAK